MGIVFIYASYSKILDPISFSNNIQNYGVTPIYIENLISLILPWIELFIGIGLISGIKYKASIDISIYMMIAFILLISQAYLRGKSIDCGCLLSDLSDTSSSEKRMHMIKRIIQDICFILYALIVKYRVIFKRDK